MHVVISNRTSNVRLVQRELTCQQDSDHRAELSTGLSHIAHCREHCTKCTPALLDLQLNNLAIGITLCAHNERDH